MLRCGDIQETHESMGSTELDGMDMNQMTPEEHKGHNND
jgi:hypothetical protein